MNKIYSMIILIIMGSYVYAQEQQDAPLTISGSVDTYYKYDFSGNANIPTSFAPEQNSMSIGMVDVMVEKSLGKASFVGEIAFGPRANNTAPGAVQNLYVSYALTDQLSVTGGFMGTFVGYEVISPAANFNYSGSYLFSNGPFQNAGVKLDYAINDKFALMVGAFQSDWDSYTADPDKGLDNLGAQVYVSPADGWDLYANVLTGSKYSQWDVTTSYQISDAFFLGLNVSQNLEYDNDKDGGFFGVAGYVQYAFSDAAALGLRYENFAPEDEVVFGLGTINAITLSGNFKAGDLTFIPEIRFDSSSNNDFFDNDNLATDAATQIVMAAVYSF